MKQLISYFNAPISNTRPLQAVTVEQVYQLITQDEALRRLTEQVRQAADFKRAKGELLPFVTPCGVFSYRNSKSLVQLSGLLPLDIDGLASLEEAERMRDAVSEDSFLQPVLTFVSPSQRGVKAFVPYHIEEGTPSAPALEQLRQEVEYAMTYCRVRFGTCDVSGKDVARSCFLCSDHNAKLRMMNYE